MKWPKSSSLIHGERAKESPLILRAGNKHSHQCSRKHVCMEREARLDWWSRAKAIWTREDFSFGCLIWVHPHALLLSLSLSLSRSRPPTVNQIWFNTSNILRVLNSLSVSLNLSPPPPCELNKLSNPLSHVHWCCWRKRLKDTKRANRT